MLQLRICPKCGAEIKSKTAYFCYACGGELEPPKVIAKEEPVEQISSQGKGFSFTIPAFLITLLKWGIIVLIIIALISGVIALFLKFKPSLEDAKKPPPNEAASTESFQPLEHTNLGRGFLPELTPATVDIFLEGTRPEIIIAKIFGESLADDFQSQVDLDLEEAASFLEENFALFARESSEATSSGEIAFVSKVRDLDFVEEKLAELPEETSPSAALVEGFLLISNSPNMIEEIEQSFRKLTLSLALKTEFAESLRHLPEKGQMLVYFASRDKEKDLLPTVRDWIPEELTGNGFIILEENGRTKVVGEEK